MNSTYRLKLFFVLFIFAIFISFTVSTIDYLRIKEKTIDETNFQIEQAANTVAYSLKTIDKVYYLLDKDIAPRMEENTKKLQEKYKHNPNFDSWNFKELAKTFEMDIYIINEKDTIEYSNVSDEIGLDFSVCCKTLNQTLNERRKTGQLYIDGIDIDQKNGEVKKFSYMATPDKKYIIELGYNLQNEVIFQHFNFLTVVDDLVNDFSLISDINVLNIGGIPYGVTTKKLKPQERRNAFEQARDTGEVVEIDSVYKGEDAVFRYVPILSGFDVGVTKTKIIEIIYNKEELDVSLKDILHKFIMQLLLILVVTLIVSTMIANWFAKPIYYAFHDSLTGLKNRAAFDDYLLQSLEDKKKTAAFFMMDLDNFKLANDYLGHQTGDHLLKLVSKQLSDIALDNNAQAFRLGGDEFAIIMQDTNRSQVEEVAQHIIDSLKEVLQSEKKINTLSITVSIGIALSTEDQDVEVMYRQADVALYESKEKGKNQFQIYGDGVDSKDPFL